MFKISNPSYPQFSGEIFMLILFYHTSWLIFVDLEGNKDVDLFLTYISTIVYFLKSKFNKTKQSLKL